MKPQILKKTVFLFAFIGLLSTQMNAQDETFLNTTSDGLWSTLGNWVNTSDGTTPSTNFPTGEAVVKFSVNLNGNQTTTSIKAALLSANPITVSGGVLTIGSSTNNATIINNNINNQFIFDCDINFVSTVANQRIRNKSNASAELIFNAGRTISLNGVRLKIQNQSPSNNVQLNGTVTGTNSIELEGNDTQNGQSGLTLGSASDFSGFTGNFFLYRYEIVSNTPTVFLKPSNRIQFNNIGGIITVNVANTLQGELRRNAWDHATDPSLAIGESTVNFNASQPNMAKLTLSSDERMVFNIDAAATELTFATSTFSATSVLNINGFQNGVLKFNNIVTQTVLDTWELNGTPVTAGQLEQDASGFINIVCTTPTDVTGFTVTDAGATQLDLAWANTTCFDEILVVAKEATAVTVTPTGDGTAYTADTAFSFGTDLGGNEYAVYKDVSNSVSVTGLTAGTNYHFTVFARKGTNWSSGVIGNGTPTAPIVTFDGFVQNPSFDDVPGDSAPWNPATKPYATVDVSTGDAHTGTYSMTHTYHTIAPSGGAHFVFNDYVHNIGSTITDAVASSLWVKVVRPSTPGVSPLVSIQGQVRTGTSDVVSSLVNKTNNKTTTKTDGTWEKLTFNLLTPDAPYSHAQFRYGLLVTNLQIGDIVYIDDLSAINIPAETTAQTGNWEDPLTWVSGNVPDANTDVTIAHTVTINSNAECFAMSINNTVSTFVSVNPGNSLTIETDVTTSNDIFLLSNSASFSSLIVKGTINGQIAYQRFVGAESTRDLISVPVTGLTFGVFSSAGANAQLFQNPATTTEKLFGPFDNSTGAYETYDEFTDAAVALVPGKGYRAATNAGSNLRFKSTATTSDVSIALTDETASGTGNYKRWNLIGNPYPSYLDFGAFFTENSSEFDPDGAYQAIYGYTGNGWTTWNNLNASDKLAPGQGFFVKAKSGGSTTDVIFKPAMRTIGSSNDFLVGRSSTPNNVLSELFLSNGSDTRTTKIYFVENQTRGLDPGYDAGAFGGSGAGIYTHLVEDNTGINFAIQALPYLDFNDVVVPVGVKVNAGVQTIIGLDNTTTNISSNINVYLEDNVTNTWTLLNTSDYTFTPTETLNGTGRFYVHYSNSVLSVKDDTLSGLNIYTDQSTKQVIVKGQLNSDTTATIYDIQGRTVQTKVLNQSSTTNTIDVNNLSTGIYIVKLNNTSGSKSQKVILK